MNHRSTLQKPHLLSIFAVFLAFTPASTFADKTEDAFKELNQAIEKELALSKPSGGRNWEDHFAPLETEDFNLNSAEIDQKLRGLFYSTQTTEVKESVQKLKRIIKEDRAEQIATFRKRTEEELAAASKAAINAKKASDLDTVLSNLKALAEQQPVIFPFGNLPPNDPVIKLGRATAFISQWQEYLANIASGSPDLALQNLEAIKQDPVDLIPRSEILSRIETIRKEQASIPQNSRQKVLDIIRGVKSLDAIPKALSDLTDLKANEKPDANWVTLISEAEKNLSSLFQAYKNYQTGLLLGIELLPKQQRSENDWMQTETTALRAELMRLTIPGLLKSPKMEPNESVDQYLDRIMAAAQETVDARMIIRVQNLRDSLSGKPDTSNSIEEQLKTTIAAKDLEEAGQWNQAVFEYHRALAKGGNLVPAKAIGKRIKEIQTKHPEAFPELHSQKQPEASTTP